MQQFEEFFKGKMDGDNFEHKFKEVVAEIVEEGLIVLKEVSAETWEAAQKNKVMVKLKNIIKYYYDSVGRMMLGKHEGLTVYVKLDDVEEALCFAPDNEPMLNLRKLIGEIIVESDGSDKHLQYCRAYNDAITDVFRIIDSQLQQ